MRPVITPPRESAKSIRSSVCPSSSSRSRPGWNGRVWPYSSETKPGRDTEILYRPAPSSLASYRPLSSVVICRCLDSAGELICTRARASGLPVSAAMTRPMMRPPPPVAGTVVSRGGAGACARTLESDRTTISAAAELFMCLRRGCVGLHVHGLRLLDHRLFSIASPARAPTPAPIPPSTSALVKRLLPSTYSPLLCVGCSAPPARSSRNSGSLHAIVEMAEVVFPGTVARRAPKGTSKRGHC